jgi:formate-dependent nitrite reductase cytochrome c552 subunit
MKRLWLVGLAGVCGLLTAGLLVLSGCGGGGGPITLPETGPGPSVSAQFLTLLPEAQKNATYVGSNRCTTCHSDAVHAGWMNTKHFQKNVGCEQCHGPGSVHVSGRAVKVARATREGEVVADILSFPKVTEPIVCGQCHGPTFEQYTNSRHSGVVDEVIEEIHDLPANYGRSCSRCHSAPFKDEFISTPWTKGLKEGKSIEEIQNETDARIVALTDAAITEIAEASHQSANCVTCHDPHTQTGKLTSTGNEAQLRRSTFSTDVNNIKPGSPIKVHSNFDHTCGTCHNGRGGKNDDTTLTNSTARPSFHENPQFNMLLGVTGSLPQGAVVQNGSHTQTPDQCVHCHMPDRRHTFTVSVDRSCLPCHTATDAATRAATVRNEMLSGLLVLKTRMELWAQQKFGKPAFWNYYSLVSEDPAVQTEAKNVQGEVPIEIKRARHNYHFIVRDRSQGVHNTPYARQLLAFAQTQLDSLGVSRKVPITRSVKEFEQTLKRDRVMMLLSESRIRPDEL